MTKKFEKHLAELLQSERVMAGEIDGLFYIIDPYRIIRLSFLYELPAEADVYPLLKSTAKNYIKFFDTENPDISYKMVELPTVAEIKKNISDLVGRKRSTVVYGCEDFAMNARYLLSVIGVLKCRVCYVPSNKYYPVLFFENDDLQSVTAEAIMRVNSQQIGYWVIEE